MTIDEALLRLLLIGQDLANVEAHLEKGEQRNLVSICREDVESVRELLGKILGSLEASAGSEENARTVKMINMIESVTAERKLRLAERRLPLD
jgi:hypothetical protein